MKKKFWTGRLKTILIVALIIAICAAVTLAITNGTSAIENVVGTILSPIRAGVASIDRLAERYYNYMFRYETLEAENAEMEKQILAMQEDIRTDVDFVLTYEELMGIFEAKEINFSALPDSPDLDEGTRAGRGFAVAGGVAAAVEELIHKEHPDIELKTQRADGLRDCRKLLMLAKAGKLDGYLLEGMACPGGCVAGAGTVVSADTAAKKLAQHMAQASGETAKDSKYRDLADQLN